MKNLRDETIEIMKEHGLIKDDINFISVEFQVWEKGTICINRFEIPVSKFLSYSNVEYDESYGGYQVALGLKIVFHNGSWLERHEYDGSEWWEYKSTPQRPVVKGNIKLIWDKYSDMTKETENEQIL